MTIDIVPYAAGEHLDWIDLAEALAAGHRRPRARISEGVLRRGRDTLLTRSAWIDGMGLAVKAATIFPGNAEAGRPSVGGGVSVLSDTDGTLRAVIDFDLVTRWKTAADSLLGAMRLARPDSRRILIVGAGTVAQALREAYAAAFPEARFTVWNRSAARAEALAVAHPGTDVAADLETAVGAADIVTCATLSSEPILRGEWLRPGQHVDLIGAFRADMREADDTALRRARLFVDSLDTTLEHIGELRDPLARGVISRGDVVADFYDLDRFRREPDDITLFKNGGGAHLDLMTCDYILGRWSARRTGA